MIILISGASHAGKTVLAQRLLESLHIPYLSIDHLKMGLIRSGQTTLTPVSKDNDLTAYLWPIVREIVKTAIENKQSLIVEGCYIPLDWYNDFEEDYRNNIHSCCIIMSEKYIRTHFEDIKRYENAIENRLYDELSIEAVLEDNAYLLKHVTSHHTQIVMIENDYNTDLEGNRFVRNLLGL